MIHQSKSWYYLGPFQTSRMELLAKIVFGYSADERKRNKFANIQTICYLSTLVLRDHSKWWAAKNEHEEGDGAHNSNNERKILTHHESLIALQNKLIQLSLKCAKNQNCGFIRTYGDQVPH